jgi:hypothetical protein
MAENLRKVWATRMNLETKARLDLLHNKYATHSAELKKMSAEMLKLEFELQMGQLEGKSPLAQQMKQLEISNLDMTAATKKDEIVKLDKARRFQDNPFEEIENEEEKTLVFRLFKEISESDDLIKHLALPPDERKRMEGGFLASAFAIFANNNKDSAPAAAIDTCQAWMIQQGINDNLILYLNQYIFMKQLNVPMPAHINPSPEERKVISNNTQGRFKEFITKSTESLQGGHCSCHGPEYCSKKCKCGEKGLGCNEFCKCFLKDGKCHSGVTPKSKMPKGPLAGPPPLPKIQPRNRPPALPKMPLKKASFFSMLASKVSMMLAGEAAPLPPPKTPPRIYPTALQVAEMDDKKQQAQILADIGCTLGNLTVDNKVTILRNTPMKSPVKLTTKTGLEMIGKGLEARRVREALKETEDNEQAFMAWSAEEQKKKDQKFANLQAENLRVTVLQEKSAIQIRTWFVNLLQKNSCDDLLAYVDISSTKNSIVFQFKSEEDQMMCLMEAIAAMTADQEVEEISEVTCVFVCFVFRCCCCCRCC